MNYFVTRFIIFLVPIILVISILEYLVGDNPKKAKSDFLIQNRDNIELLIQGPSTMACALNPEFLDYATASLSITGNTISVDHAIFYSQIEQLPSLKLIIFDLSNGYLEYSDPSFSKSGSLLLHYDLIKNSNSKDLKDYLISTANFKYAVNKSKDILLRGDKEEFNQWGFLTTLNQTPYSFKTFDYDISQIKESTAVNKIFEVHRSHNDIAYAYNTQLLREMINTCKEKNIKIVFLSPPKFSYYQEVTNDYHQRRSEFLKTIVDNHNVFFYDHEELNNENPTLFYDILHLNYQGAKEYSIFINNMLNTPSLLPK